MRSGEITYDTLVTLNKDDSGQVTAIVANMVNINRLQADLTENMTKNIKDSKTSEIKIPLGNMFGNVFLSGLGPRISFNIISVNSTKASFSSTFSSAGINQTRHRIILEANVIVSVLVPGAISSVSVNSQIMIAETVIVGKVPQTYAYFGSENTDNDDLKSNLQKYQLIR
jgi:sporulation protein YunB